jgi:hypothetical protein
MVRHIEQTQGRGVARVTLSVPGEAVGRCARWQTSAKPVSSESHRRREYPLWCDNALINSMVDISRVSISLANTYLLLWTCGKIKYQDPKVLDASAN